MTVKAFGLWGDTIEVALSSDDTANAMCAVVQVSPPGGGPPIHRHTREDEILMALEGDYLFFETDRWRPMPINQPIYAARGPHTFRNVGASVGRVMATIVPGQFDKLFETLSPLSLETDMDRIAEICAMYGVTPLPPDAAPPLPIAPDTARST